MPRSTFRRFFCNLPASHCGHPTRSTRAHLFHNQSHIFFSHFSESSRRIPTSSNLLSLHFRSTASGSILVLRLPMDYRKQPRQARPSTQGEMRRHETRRLIAVSTPSEEPPPGPLRLALANKDDRSPSNPVRRSPAVTPNSLPWNSAPFPPHGALRVPSERPRLTG